MPSSNAVARTRLDARLSLVAPLRAERPPHRGWVRAIRDALGMSGAELAQRMGVSQSSIDDLEHSEVNDRAQLGTLRRAANALDCDLVYLFVPRTSLEDNVQRQAHAQAIQHMQRVGHHSRLEDQEVPTELGGRHIEEFAATLIDRRGLWASPAR